MKGMVKPRVCDKETLEKSVQSRFRQLQSHVSIRPEFPMGVEDVIFFSMKNIESKPVAKSQGFKPLRWITKVRGGLLPAPSQNGPVDMAVFP